MGFSIVNGTNGFSGYAQRVDDYSGTGGSGYYAEYGIANSEFQPLVTASYDLSFKYRSNVHLNVGHYYDFVLGTVAPNTGSATLATFNNLSIPAGSLFGFHININSYLNGTSSSSLTVPASGTINLTTDTGKDWAAGFGVYIYNASASIFGTISSYNSGTGAMAVSVSSSSGTGTYTSWTVRYYGDYSTSGAWFEVDEVNLYQL